MHTNVDRARKIFTAAALMVVPLVLGELFPAIRSLPAAAAPGSNRTPSSNAKPARPLL